MCVCGVLCFSYLSSISYSLLLLWLLWSITWSWNMSVHKFCGSCRRYQGLHVRTTQEVFVAVHRHATGMHICTLSCITNSIDKGVCLKASHCCHVLTKTSTSTWFQNITKIMCCSLPLPKPNIRLLVRFFGVLHRSCNSYRLSRDCMIHKYSASLRTRGTAIVVFLVWIKYVKR